MTTTEQLRSALSSGPIDRWLAPLVRFLHIEAASGVVLPACTAVALALANSPAADWFAQVSKTPARTSTCSCGVFIWLAFRKAGVHPTVAGVLLGLLTPANSVHDGAVSQCACLPCR